VQKSRTLAPGGFGALLRRWRERRRLSRLDLATDAEISTRHPSFLETGRAQPSRAMVLLLARARRRTTRWLIPEER
jgi:transcriptional regulator with XRE-family HTH domain